MSSWKIQINFYIFKCQVKMVNWNRSMIMPRTFLQTKSFLISNFPKFWLNSTKSWRRPLVRITLRFSRKSVWCWDKMCYYVLRIKCQRISKKIILHLVMLPSEINLKGHESVLKWSKGGRKRKENKRSHFADVYFAPSLQHNLWLHLAWREISEKKKKKSYFSACLGCQELFNSGSRQLSRSSTQIFYLLVNIRIISVFNMFSIKWKIFWKNTQ